MRKLVICHRAQAVLIHEVRGCLQLGGVGSGLCHSQVKHAPQIFLRYGKRAAGGMINLPEVLKRGKTGRF